MLSPDAGTESLREQQAGKIYSVLNQAASFRLQFINSKRHNGYPSRPSMRSKGLSASPDAVSYSDRSGCLCRAGSAPPRGARQQTAGPPGDQRGPAGTKALRKEPSLPF